MRDVYSHAANVITWLGEGTRRSPLVFPLISDLYRNLNDIGYLEKALLDNKRRPQWLALSELLALEYWTRIWVIQEVNSAGRKTLRWGSDSMPWEEFAAVQFEMGVAASDQLDTKAWAIAHSLDLWNKLEVGGPKVLNLPTTTPKSVIPELHDLLYHSFSHGHVATDSRDMIYALVGISQARDDPRMVIDYSLSVRQVYIQTVDYTLHRQKDLDVIYHGPTPLQNIHELPSWARDWDANRMRHNPLIQTSKRFKPFSASQEILAEASIDKKQGTLRASGLIADSVRVVGESSKSQHTEDYANSILTIISWYSLWLSLNVAHEGSFTRTLICDRFEEQPIPEMASISLQLVLGSVIRLARRYHSQEELSQKLPSLPEGFDQSDEWCESWQRDIILSTLGRRFLISEGGNIGLCPEDYQKGDIIVVLLGCAVPILLRPHDGFYEMIGDVFLDGYMYGKGIDELNEGKHKLQDFEIR